MGGIAAALREARWLTPARLRAYGLAGAILSLALAFAFLRVIAGQGGMTAGDVDFIAFYAAGRLALAGMPAMAWDIVQHAAMREAVLGGPASLYNFLHPPPFLMLVLPFALAPYFWALAAWVTATGLAMLAALRAWGATGAALAAALLAPASVINAASGQTGFLTAALLALAGPAIGARPWLAGLAFALLALKPQLGLLVLPALLAARRWPEIGWGAGFFAGTCLASLVVLGPEPWRAFIGIALAYQEAVRGGTLSPWKLQSVAAFATTAGLGGTAAAVLQVAAALAAILGVVAVLRRRPGGCAEVAAVAAGLPLVTPYILLYDLTVLLVPLAWLLAEGRRAGFRPWEKTVMVLALVAPGVALFAGLWLGVSLTAPVSALLLLVVLARIRAGAPRPTPGRAGPA